MINTNLFMIEEMLILKSIEEKFYLDSDIDCLISELSKIEDISDDILISEYITSLKNKIISNNLSLSDVKELFDCFDFTIDEDDLIEHEF